MAVEGRVLRQDDAVGITHLHQPHDGIDATLVALHVLHPEPIDPELVRGFDMMLSEMLLEGGRRPLVEQYSHRARSYAV
jgi:hypothetical protein